MVMDTPVGLPPELLRSLDGCGDPIIVVGERWDIVHWNDAVETALGQTPDDVRGRRCYEIVAGIDGGGREICRLHCEKWALARRGARIRNFDVRVLPSHERWANVSILPVPDATGRPVALVHIIRNIGRSKRIERFVQEIAAESDEVLATHVSNGVVHEPAAIHLTDRELEVLRLLAHGAGTVIIADRLGVSRHTVHNHIAVMLNKLGVHSRAEAVAYAFEHHLA